MSLFFDKYHFISELEITLAATTTLEPIWVSKMHTGVFALEFVVGYPDPVTVMYCKLLNIPAVGDIEDRDQVESIVKIAGS